MNGIFPGNFLSGAITMGLFVISAFFVKFWWRTRDMLFAIFAGAFCLLALNQVAFTLSGSATREQVWIYLLRLAAFALLIAAIIHKNTQGRRR